MSSWIPTVPGGLADPDKIRPKVGFFTIVGGGAENTHPIYVKITPFVRDLLLKQCEEECRGMSEVVEAAIIEYMEKR